MWFTFCSFLAAKDTKDAKGRKYGKGLVSLVFSASFVFSIFLAFVILFASHETGAVWGDGGMVLLVSTLYPSFRGPFDFGSAGPCRRITL